MSDGLIQGEDGPARCWWCGDDPLYVHYHDHEWGRPVDDDIRLFEKICLEGFQAGLSWITILRKRENFRKAFKNFNFEKVARFTDKHVDALLQDEGIIRHRGKIEAIINNAKAVSDLIDEYGSLATYFWGFEPDPRNRPQVLDHATLCSISTSPESTALSKDLKKRGFKFVGPTTMYAHMQAMGMVNDHIEGCHMRDEVELLRKNFTRPS